MAAAAMLVSLVARFDPALVHNCRAADIDPTATVSAGGRLVETVPLLTNSGPVMGAGPGTFVASAASITLRTALQLPAGRQVVAGSVADFATGRTGHEPGPQLPACLLLMWVTRVAR
jgi:hypothetical protein